MLINDILFTVLGILAPLIFLIGLSIFVKKKFDSYYGVFFGLVFSGFIFGAIQASAGKTYIINSGLTYDAYRTFGSFDFELDNGTFKSINPEQGKTIIINNTSELIIIDKIIYSPQGYYKNRSEWKDISNDIDSSHENENSNSFLVQPQSYESFSIPKSTINYFFDEEIPNVVEEYGVSGKITKYWLHG